MANSVKLLTKYTATGNIELAEKVTVPNSVWYANITDQSVAVFKAGDMIMVEVGGLTNAQVTALKARNNIIVFNDKNDTEPAYKDDVLLKAEIQSIGTKLVSIFGVSAALITKWVDANSCFSRLTMEKALDKLCGDGKPTQ